MFVQALACLATQHVCLRRFASLGYELERPVLDCEPVVHIVAPRPHRHKYRVWLNSGEVRRIS